MRRLLPIALSLVLVACGGGDAPAPEATPAPEAAAPAKPTPVPKPTPAPKAAAAEYDNPAMLDPKLANETAPDTFTVDFKTTKGSILVDVTREWAPNGADRLYNLVKIGYFTDVAMFRVIPGFMAQFGIHGDPAVNKVWRTARIPADEVKQSNTPGMLTFAMAGRADTRTTQLFMNFGDNARLDGMGFAPVGKLRDMKVLNALYGGYGEGAPRGKGPFQGKLQSEGNAYLKADFPEMDYIVSATIAE